MVTIYRQRFDVSSNDTVFNAAPYTFDPSVVEVSSTGTYSTVEPLLNDSRSPC